MPTPLPVLVCPACGLPGSTFLCQRTDGENLQICSRCETIYCAERPSSLNTLYVGAGGLEKTEQALEAARWRLGWLLYACDVLKAPLTPLWDSACGYGDFLSLARGFELEALRGSDLPPRADWLSKELGLGVHAMTWDDWRPPDLLDAPPRVVTAWDILEHVPHPRDAVAQWAEFLGLDGVLVFATPNADIVHDLPNPAHWSGFGRHFEHLQYFGEAGLNALLGGYFRTRFFCGLRQRGDDLILGLACNREPTLRQAQLLSSVLEEPAVLLDAIRARELGPWGLLGAALLEAVAGEPTVAEEAALFAEVSGAPPAASAFVRGLVSLKRHRLEAARVDLAVASQSARLREASQVMLVTVLERLLADAETLGEARKVAAIAAEEQRRHDEARAMALEKQLMPPPPPRFLTRRGAHRGPRVVSPFAVVRGAARRLVEGPLALWQALRSRLKLRKMPQDKARRQQIEARDRALRPHVGQRVVIVLPSEADAGWPSRWISLGEALAGPSCVVIVVDESADEAFAVLAPRVFSCRGVHLVEDLPSPWLIVREPYQLALVSRFYWPWLIYDAPLPPIVPVASSAVEAAVSPQEPWLAARAALPTRGSARVPHNEREGQEGVDVNAWAPEQLLRAHEALLRDAQVVVARTRNAYETAQALRPDVLWVPDGAAPSFWSLEDKAMTPPELAAVVAAHRPVAGFWGPVGPDLDWDLIREVSRRLPHWAFVFIGAVSQPAPDDLAGNVYLLGARPDAALPHYVACFSAVFLPVRQEVALQGLSAPVLFAGLMAGKPGVTAPSPEAELLRTVRIAETAEDFAAALEAARASVGLPAAQAARLKEAELHTAQLRVEPLIEAIVEAELQPRDRAVILTQTPFAASGSDHRAAQFARAWVSRGWQVLYVQTGATGLRAGRRMVPPGMSLVTVQQWEGHSHVANAPKGRYVGVLTSPHPLFEPLIQTMQASGAEVVYDMVEDEEAYRDPAGFDHGSEARLAGLADVLTAPTLGAAAVLEARCGRTVHPLPDGVDRALFNRRKVRPRPTDLPSGRPLLLYVGALWDTVIDWRLLFTVLEAYPSASVVLVGEYAEQCPYAIPAHLHILGSRARGTLAAYLQAADVVILPLVQRPGQASPRPSEVLAALVLGRSVVTTAYGERVSWPGLTVAAEPAAFVAAIARALENKTDAAVADALATVNSWEYRLDGLLELIFPPLTPLTSEAAETVSAEELAVLSEVLLEEGVAAAPLEAVETVSAEELAQPDLRPGFDDMPSDTKTT